MVIKPTKNIIMINENKKSCSTCAYKRNIPGNTHIACKFDFFGQGVPMPNGDKHGIKNGWYAFPFNYDPIWMVEECTVHSKTADPNKTIKNNPLFDILSLLR